MALAQPSTSGSMTATGSSQSRLDKRMSKDDMFFRTARQKQGLDRRTSRDDMYIRGRMAEMSHYHVPGPGSTLTPEHSPSFPVIKEASIPIRVQTPESITSGEIPIGMALGSPPLRPDPSPSRWKAQFPPASPRTVSSSGPLSAGAAPVNSLQRKKTGKRKLFGLFGKRRDESQGLAQSDARKSTITLARTIEVSSSSINLAAKSTPTRSNTQAERKVPKHKPIMIRSNTVPQNADAPPSQPKSAGLPGRQENAYRQPPANSPPIPSFLDVKIPDTKLERYSVMFSDVLGPRPPKQEHSESLLSRRQATLLRLKTIDDKIEAEEMEKERSRQRRATSPQSTATPQLRLFPMPLEGRDTPAMDTPTSRSRPLRSNTSPGSLPSPTQATFDTKISNTATTHHGPTLVVPNPFDSSPQLIKQPTRELEPIYPTDTTFQFGPGKSALILDSPIELKSPGEEIINSRPLKPTLHEPQWQMVSSQSLSTSSTTSGRRGRSPSAASSATPHTHVPLPSSEVDDTEAAMQSAVEVSIARQISISRQQRQLLRPLQARRGVGAGAGGEGSTSVSPLGVKIVKSPTPSRRLGGEQEIKETKSSTPTLIHPRERAVNPAHLAQNRKSSWAVVEGG
ncbi:hypothetical protein DHEL01_v203223 [Diaporthe helianthi]|uniref:Uncharacterized protein n=1 Tax=Diaporthe helianthi TaxID=158607 RepID=A0A2P5I7C9_DIAHE|nr:hypothetical protein DHEL01_v203223 [Diaporthe helianthi]